MKCLYCGAELQENARFCLYCMKQLQETTTIHPPAAKKHGRKKLLALLLCAVVLAAAIFAGLRLSRRAKPEPLPDLLPEGDFGLIADFNSLYFSVIEVTQHQNCEALWNPSALALYDRTDKIQTFGAPVNLPGAALRIRFFNDGTQIFTSLTGLTEQTLDDGIRLLECTANAVYWEMSVEEVDLVNNPPTQSVAASDACVVRLGLDSPDPSHPDGNAQITVKRIRLDLEPTTVLPDAPNLYLLYELRSRTFGDTVYYDLFLFHGQEQVNSRT